MKNNSPRQSEPKLMPRRENAGGPSMVWAAVLAAMVVMLIIGMLRPQAPAVTVNSADKAVVQTDGGRDRP